MQSPNIVYIKDKPVATKKAVKVTGFISSQTSLKSQTFNFNEIESNSSQFMLPKMPLMRDAVQMTRESHS